MTSKGLVVGLSLFLAAGVASAAPAKQAKRASLKVLDTRPLAVRGTGFKPYERVRVRYSSTGAVQVRTRIASKTGTFTIRFELPVTACAVSSVQALGGKGSRALVVPPVSDADCKPALQAELLDRHYPDSRATR